MQVATPTPPPNPKKRKDAAASSNEDEKTEEPKTKKKKKRAPSRDADLKKPLHVANRYWRYVRSALGAAPIKSFSSTAAVAAAARRGLFLPLKMLVEAYTAKHGRKPVRVFGKESVEPRLSAYFAAPSADRRKPYSYSGKKVDVEPWPPVLAALERVSAFHASRVELAETLARIVRRFEPLFARIFRSPQVPNNCPLQVPNNVPPQVPNNGPPPPASAPTANGEGGGGSISRLFTDGALFSAPEAMGAEAAEAFTALTDQDWTKPQAASVAVEWCRRPEVHVLNEKARESMLAAMSPPVRNGYVGGLFLLISQYVGWAVAPRVSFNSALVNFYRDGSDNIGEHRDKDAMLGSIASWSIYPSTVKALDRAMLRRFRARVEPLYNQERLVEAVPEELRNLVFELEPDSCFIMRPGMQQTFVHSIAPTKKTVLPRINVTFRNHK